MSDMLDASDRSWFDRNSARAADALAKAGVEYRAGAHRPVPIVRHATHNGEASFDTLKELVLEATGLMPAELMSARRKAQVVVARHALYELARKYTRLSLPALAHLTGRKDHTTVLHALRRVKERPWVTQHIIDYVEARLG